MTTSLGHFRSDNTVLKALKDSHKLFASPQLLPTMGPKADDASKGFLMAIVSTEDTSAEIHSSVANTLQLSELKQQSY